MDIMTWQRANCSVNSMFGRCECLTEMPAFMTKVNSSKEIIRRVNLLGLIVVRKISLITELIEYVTRRTFKQGITR